MTVQFRMMASSSHTKPPTRRRLKTNLRVTLLLALLVFILVTMYIAQLQRDWTVNTRPELRHSSKRLFQTAANGASNDRVIKGREFSGNVKPYTGTSNKRTTQYGAAAAPPLSNMNAVFESMFSEKVTFGEAFSDEKSPFDTEDISNDIQLGTTAEKRGFRVAAKECEDGPTSGTRRNPVVWLAEGELPIMAHVRLVFERLGFSVVTNNASGPWDVLWTRSFEPLIWPSVMDNLKSHQKINHFLGMGYVTRKMILSTLDHPAIPKAFVLPMEKKLFAKYTKQNPNKLWLKKGAHHMGIQLVDVKEFDMVVNETIAQEFVGNPLLLDGRKFDLGVYAVVTSIDPLRIYTIPESVYVRSCQKDYYPFNVNDPDTYKIAMYNYTPMWELPNVKHLYTEGLLSNKAIVDTYFRSQGKDLTNVWTQMDEIIRKIFLMQNAYMRPNLVKYNATRHFFELVRGDFVIDANLGVHLMEINMTPGLSTATRYPENRLLYEQVVYNTLRLTGVATMLRDHYHNSDADTAEMQVSNQDIAVFPEWCARDTCHDCSSKECMVCLVCVSATTRQNFKDAYLEHVNRGSCRRIFPPKLNRAEALEWHPKRDTYNLSQYHRSARHVFVWFVGMCRKDATFCQ